MLFYHHERKQAKSNINILSVLVATLIYRFHPASIVNMNQNDVDRKEFLLEIYKNISFQIQDIGVKTKEANLYYNDNRNAWFYIVFVLFVFAGSFTALMRNYFKR